MELGETTTVTPAFRRAASTPTRRRGPPSFAFRFTGYTLVFLGALMLLPRAVRPGDISAFKEGGLVETLQVGLVALTVSVLAIGAARDPARRTLLAVLAMLAGFALVREFDSFFESFIPVLGWELPAGCLVAGGAWFAWPRRRGLAEQVRAFAGTGGFGLLWAGVIVQALFAQLVGHGGFLQVVMQDAYDRDVKRAVEESLETLGYGLVLIGAVETLAGGLRLGPAETCAAPRGPRPSA